jgi:anti-sigma B factor antagonist
MQVAETTDGGISILTLQGDIDLHHSPQLRSVLQGKVKAKCPALLIDMKEVGYIDSSGLATLVEYFQGSRAHAGKVALATLSPRVKSVFELVRLNEIFPIYPTLDEARQGLQG